MVDRSTVEDFSGSVLGTVPLFYFEIKEVAFTGHDNDDKVVIDVSPDPS